MPDLLWALYEFYRLNKMSQLLSVFVQLKKILNFNFSISIYLLDFFFHSRISWNIYSYNSFWKFLFFESIKIYKIIQYNIFMKLINFILME